MRRFLIATVLGLLASPNLIRPALAETPPPRCTLLGQMAVSSWLEMMGSLSQKQDDAVDPVVARLDNLSATYVTLDCDVQMLGSAMDCLLSDAGGRAPRELAQRCMGLSGLTAPE